MPFFASTPGTRIGTIGSLALAAAWTATSFGAALMPAPAAAQAPGKSYYRAVLAQPTSDSRTIAADLVWACNATSCTASKGTSRPLRVCRELKRKFGEVASFTAKGEALAADELAKCNG